MKICGGGVRNSKFANSLKTRLKLTNFLIKSLNLYLKSNTNNKKLSILADIALMFEATNEYPRELYISSVDYSKDEIPIFLLYQVGQGQFEPYEAICTILKFIQILGYEPFSCLEARKNNNYSDFSMFKIGAKN